MRKSLAFGLATLLMATAASEVSAQRGRSAEAIPLDREIVRRDRETDRFEVGKDKGRLVKLVLKAQVSAVRVHKVRVKFGNGEESTVEVGKLLETDGPALTIDLNDKARRGRLVQWADVTYRTKPGAKRRAIIALSGIPFVQPRPETRFEAVASDRFNLSRRRLALDIGRKAGRMDVIRIAVERRDLWIEDVVVEFGNGTTKTFEIKGWLTAGSTSPKLSLGQNPRFVKQVVLKIRPRGGQRQVHVKVLAHLVKRSQGDNGRDGIRLGEPPRTDRNGDPRGFQKVGTADLRNRVRAVGIDAGPRFGRITDLAVGVARNGAYIREIVITYGNGKQDKVEIDKRLARGEISPAVRLERHRLIRSVEVVGRSRRRGPNATVTLYVNPRDRNGLQRPDRPARDWDLLASRTAPLFRTETATVPVGRRAGRIRALRLAVKRENVRIRSLQIRYANGREQDINLTGKIPAGSTTNEVRLDHPFIDEIRIRFQTSLNLRGEGVVEFWALK